ncbi:hypothetical protein B0H66DRAFT_583954 [Apodospora peruviana]|uniref:Uncharacterized protein n=1 Tax=Apodospora peruviana TaxID=516989 RepID=A0AAE0HYZ2_9PEZI|nr:hypothetical protein B0H66DRAFT_583954 [Apodospora peruviana]
MEDLRRAFEDEPLKPKPAGHNPPRKPDKVAQEDSEGVLGSISLEDNRRRYIRDSSGTDRPQARSSMPSRDNADAADAAIMGSHDFKKDNRAKTVDGDWASKVKKHTDTSSLLDLPNSWAATSQPQQPQQPQKAPGHPRPVLQRPTQARDDIVVPERSSSHDREQVLIPEKAMRELDKMRKELQDANNRVIQAERTVRQAEQHLESNFNDMATGNDQLLSVVEGLEKENQRLKADLDDARSHIFSLQPYRKDLTPEEVGRDFDDLVTGVADWVTKFAEPILDDPSKLEEVLVMMKKKPADVQKLKKHLKSHPDIINGSLFPETDIDILIAIAMRFLHDNIFQKILYGAVPSPVEAVNFLEASMQTNVEPKRDLFALRTWRAETLNAVICSPEYKKSRHSRMKELTVELASVFRIFYKDIDFNAFHCSCQEHVIQPAVEFHEKLLTATHHYYPVVNSYILWGPNQVLEEKSQDFIDNLSDLRCENVLQNRKLFNIAKLNPKPTRADLLNDLINVATIVPGLYMRQIGKRDTLKTPKVVRRQQMLVAWGAEAQREAFMASSEPTLMHRIQASTRDRQDRYTEGSVFSLKNISWV